MHRRYAKKNIPIELLRALVTIIDSGSYTKAADTLDLTQSAISSQIARLGQLLGGSIFAKGQGNMTPTKRGLLALQYARRMLAMNDELLTFAGPNSAPRQFVIGLPSWLGRERLVQIFERCSAGEPVSFRCDRVERLLGDLNVGSIDIAYLCNTINSPRITIAQWSEPTVWMKSPKLALRPGVRFPLRSFRRGSPPLRRVSACWRRRRAASSPASKSSATACPRCRPTRPASTPVTGALTRELARLARTDGCETLSYLLELATIEAELMGGPPEGQSFS
jgi:DNA-binding transcriptional LysR family regulator